MISNGEIFLLQRKRAEFNGKQHRNLVGKGFHVVSGSRQTGRSRDAAQTEDRIALDVGIQLHSGLTRRASMEGLATPVIETKYRAAICSRLIPAALSARQIAC